MGQSGGDAANGTLYGAAWADRARVYYCTRITADRCYRTPEYRRRRGTDGRNFRTAERRPADITYLIVVGVIMRFDVRVYYHFYWLSYHGVIIIIVVVNDRIAYKTRSSAVAAVVCVWRRPGRRRRRRHKRRAWERVARDVTITVWRRLSRYTLNECVCACVAGRGRRWIDVHHAFTADRVPGL